MSKRKGGWEKMKEAEEKRKRDSAILKATPKLHSYFKTQSEASVGGDTFETDTDINSVVATEADKVDASNDEKLLQNLTAVNVDGGGVENNTFPDDPGLWDPITQDLRDYWIFKGTDSCSHTDADFSETVREYPRQNRYLTKSMFVSVKPNK
jgi:hypothetical protein